MPHRIDARLKPQRLVGVVANKKGGLLVADAVGNTSWRVIAAP